MIGERYHAFLPHVTLFLPSTLRCNNKALVFWMTDHEPIDDWWRGLRCHKEKTKGMLGNIVALGCGDSANTGVLREVTPNVLLMTDVTPENLRAYFRWVSQ